MKDLYIVTGANGHLGSAVVRLLASSECDVRGLLLPGESANEYENAVYFYGDVRSADSMRALFTDCEGRRTYVIHTAGIVDISGKMTPLLREVNVDGTKNIVSLCREYKVSRMVYVSSVHAIRCGRGVRSHEISDFSPDAVSGGYAKTKAEATRAVLRAAGEGLDAVVVHPSGIIGPYCEGSNNLVRLASDYLRGRLPACVRGGYDIVDVRDVALGCIKAAESGRKGECYILSNKYVEIKELLKILRETGGGRRLPVLPVWLARAALPVLQRIALRRGEAPLYTAYSLEALSSGDRFSHEKAERELGWRPRDLRETLADTVQWLRHKGNTVTSV